MGLVVALFGGLVVSGCCICIPYFALLLLVVVLDCAD